MYGIVYHSCTEPDICKRKGDQLVDKLRDYLVASRCL